MTRYYKKESPYYNLTELARKNRLKATPEEDLLWERLRARRFLNLKFRRQAPLGRYIADFYCPDKRLVIELDGAQHFTAEGKRADGLRDRELSSLGFKVIRFKNARIREKLDQVLESVAAEIQEFEILK